MLVRLPRTVTATAMLLVAAVAATAQTAAPSSETPPSAVTTPRTGMAACRADMQALCADVERGKGRKAQCLVDNRAKASPECQAAMSGLQQLQANRVGEGKRRNGRLVACRADLATLCVDAAKGGDRIRCLRQNETKLSPECSTTLKVLRQARAGAARTARQACRPDTQALCATAENSRRGMLGCLRQNESRVSLACSQALAALPVPRRNREDAASTTVVPPNAKAPAQ